MFAVLFAENYNFDEYPTPYSGGRGRVKHRLLKIL